MQDGGLRTDPKVWQKDQRDIGGRPSPEYRQHDARTRRRRSDRKMLRSSVSSAATPRKRMLVGASEYPRRTCQKMSPGWTQSQQRRRDRVRARDRERPQTA